jgi:MoaA/NifB/PqqE/SkfB family radical SAM enzyme
LLRLGVNDVSVSLDGYRPATLKTMSGGLDVFDIVTANIREIAKQCYVTAGIVLDDANLDEGLKTIEFAYSLGVSDIRLTTASQSKVYAAVYDKIPRDILDKFPILNYRVESSKNTGLCVRGMTERDSPYCGLTWDDSVIAGKYHFPCAVYMREGGAAIGRVGPDMRQARIAWANSHDTYHDPICRRYCMDFYIAYNNEFARWHIVSTPTPLIKEDPFRCFRSKDVCHDPVCNGAPCSNDSAWDSTEAARCKGCGRLRLLKHRTNRRYP